MQSNRSRTPQKIAGVAVIWNDRGKILIDRRRPSGFMGGMWEFPGGKLEPGETVEECIKREIREELSIEIAVDSHLITIEYDYTHFRVTLIVHRCRLLSGVPQPIECDEIRWVTLEELDEYNFPAANIQIVRALRQL